MKLNLGCGELLLPGYVNCDLYVKADVMCDAKFLPFKSDSIEEIYACHLIEHFDFKEAFEVLAEWKRVLVFGGVLRIETPDLLASCKKFVESTERERIDMYSHFFAKPWVKGEVHKFLYTESQLRWTLETVGFKVLGRVPALRYIGREDICLGMVAQKC